MKPRAMIAAFATVAAIAAASGLGTTAAQAATTCTWGGTPVNPTGWFEFTGQGLTNTPSAYGLAFRATGPLGGGCTGTFTYKGEVNALSTCAWGSFEATPSGLPGIAHVAGVLPVGLAPAILYDRAGNVVGQEDPQVLTNATDENDPAFTDCNTPEGFTGGYFSSVIELLG
jgi:hypothetical protein